MPSTNLNTMNSASLNNSIVPVYNHAHAIDEAYEVGASMDRQMAIYTESLFRWEAVDVAGTLITLDDVLAEVEFELNQVSALLMRGKADEATALNNQILTKALESLIVDALASV